MSVSPEPRPIPASPHDEPIKALIFMLAAQFFFSLNIFLIRLSEDLERRLTGLSFDLRPWEPMLYRSVLLAGWCLWRLRDERGAEPSPRENRWLWARGIVGVMSLTAYYFAALHVPLGMASLFSNSSPLYVAVLALLFSGERISGFRAVCLVSGFMGVGMVLLGAVHALEGIAFWELAIAALSGPLAATAYFSIRQLKRIKNERIMISLGYAGCIGGAVGIFIEGYAPPTDWIAHAVLILSGFPAVFAQECLTRAFRSAPASQVAPLQYMGPIFATGLAYFFLAESLPLAAVWGVALVLTFGLGLPYAEALRERRAARLKQN